MFVLQFIWQLQYDATTTVVTAGVCVRRLRIVLDGLWWEIIPDGARLRGPNSVGSDPSKSSCKLLHRIHPVVEKPLTFECHYFGHCPTLATYNYGIGEQKVMSHRTDFKERIAAIAAHGIILMYRQITCIYYMIFQTCGLLYIEKNVLVRIWYSNMQLIPCMIAKTVCWTLILNNLVVNCGIKSILRDKPNKKANRYASSF